ncbi:hypothetical protein OPIT5_00300 (plasmid) [Opitutaceae bacterium TAV5]|nr:hypothetical protein OPIT5_00300 [Opitutaceae bacterium TAV5]
MNNTIISIVQTHINTIRDVGRKYGREEDAWNRQFPLGPDGREGIFTLDECLTALKFARSFQPDAERACQALTALPETESLVVRYVAGARGYGQATVTHTLTTSGDEGRFMLLRRNALMLEQLNESMQALAKSSRDLVTDDYLFGSEENNEIAEKYYKAFSLVVDSFGEVEKALAGCHELPGRVAVPGEEDGNRKPLPTASANAHGAAYHR